MLELITFAVLSAVTLVSAILVITRRNAVHSVIWLIVTLFAVGGIFLLQHAEFLFAVQIILYVGGIMVLFLFVVMLVNLDVAIKQARFARQWQVALLTAVLLLATARLCALQPRAGPQFAGAPADFCPRTKHPGGGYGPLPELHAAGGDRLGAVVGGDGRRCDHGQEEAGMIPTEYYIFLGSGLFTIGVIGVLTRRNVLIILMSIELILNAVNINLVALSQYFRSVDGQVFAIFVITDAAAEAAVGLGLIIALFRNKETVNADEIDLLKW